MDGFYYASEYTGSGGAINADNDLTIINSTFKNNSAHLWAYYRDMGSTINSDEGNGGAINCLGYLHLKNSYFTKNAHHSITAGNSEILNCNFENQDVFEACTNCNVTFINSTFTKCGEIKSYYYDINLYIDNCSFKNAKSGLIDIFQTGNVVINNTRLENNSINLYDTSLIEIDGYAKIINTTFIKNSVSLTGILNLNKYKLTNCTFINNSPAAIISSDKLFDDDFNRIYLKVKVNDQPAKVYYNCGKSVKIDSNYNVAIYRNGKAYEGSLKRTYQFTYIPVSTWKAGTYKITLKPVESYIKSTTFKVTVLKAPTVIKAPKITAKYKKSKYFTVKVTHKITKKAVKNTFVKLKIGKKTYKIKTNNKGIAKFNTKQLKIGTHKVEITSGNSNYKISAKSQIKIKI